MAAMTDDATPVYPILETPAEGIPDVISDPSDLLAAMTALSAAHGPLAIDTERAQGFRYSAKAYLLQLRREGAGTFLIDPVAFENGQPHPDFSGYAADLADADWILHAATQDLPCLAELKFLPQHLFDSELAARLLDLPRVNLTALMETALGVTLRKEHSAADWSKRPIPEDWRSYAALDVERLIDLREWLIGELTAAEKLDWAYQEFSYLCEHAADPPGLRVDPWRRTSGLHAIHSPTALAVVRELWQAREELALSLDRAPGRVLPDRAITELAGLLQSSQQARLTRSDLRKVRAFNNRFAAKHEHLWLAALERAAELTPDELPARHISIDGPPQPRSWERRWPSSYRRFYRIRPALAELSEEHHVPLENLLTPDHLRRLLWGSPDEIAISDIEARLAELGARPWQRLLCVPVIAANW